jgi:hypothetical protein
MESTVEIKILPFPHVIVSNMYCEEELKLIWKELDFLTDAQKLELPKSYGGARDALGNYLTTSRALVLDRFYSNSETSNILNINKKLHTEGYTYLLSELSPDLKFIPSVNADITKIRYYGNGDVYHAHVDYKYACLAFSYFHKEPKKFSGGRLIFPEHDYIFNCENNSMILMPGYVEHAVEKITTAERPFSGNSRYCMSQFFYFDPNI